MRTPCYRCSTFCADRCTVYRVVSNRQTFCNATATDTGPTTLLRLEAETLRSVLQESPEGLLQLVKSVARQYRRVNYVVYVHVLGCGSSFDVIFDHFSRISQRHATLHAPCHTLLSTRAYWMLTGACDPMV